MARSAVTYYELLGVLPTASPDEVRRAYHRAIRRFHPDVNKAADASHITMRLNDAWATLRDPASRAEYDRLVIERAEPVESDTWRDAAESPHSYASRYWSPAYQPKVEAPTVAMRVGRLVGDALRVLVLVAFVGSVIHWLPLVAALVVGIFAARIIGRRV